MRASWTAALLLVCAGGACGIDAVGLATGEPADASGDVSAPFDAGADGTIGVDSGTGDASPDASTDADAGVLRETCREILLANPSATNGLYTVDPATDGGADASWDAGSFTVRCDMTTANGGWTLVARELAGSTGQLRFLGADSQNPTTLAIGTTSGIIGRRFLGRYADVWIDWDVASFIRFTLPASFDLFANVADTSVGVQNESTSDSTLAGWFAGGSGAQVCLASRFADVRPGDTSWAVKARDDNNNACGCNSTNWQGRGAYYGGTIDGQQTSCIGWGGGWAGVKANGAPKGGIVPTYETRIWIR